MADSGYSGTPQARKLGIRPDQRVILDHPPAGWSLEVAPVQDGTEVRAPLVIAFFAEAAAVPARLTALAPGIRPDGAIWAAWPRRAAGHRSDVDESLIRDTALSLGLVDNKVAAIDENWSGLRLTWRRELR